MNETAAHRVSDVPRAPRARRHGGWGITTTVVSLVVLAVHHFWWTYSRMLDDLERPSGGGASSIVSINQTVNAVTVVALVLAVVAPVFAWIVRRSPVWPPLVVTALAFVVTWALNRDEVNLIHGLRLPGW